MDATVTILAGAIAHLGSASHGTYQEPAAFGHLQSLSECSKTPDTARLLAAASGSMAQVQPENFSTQFHAALLNVLGEFAGQAIISGITQLIDAWSCHAQTVTAATTDAQAAMAAIDTMDTEAAHSCEEMATQAAGNIDMVCAALATRNPQDNPEQFHRLVMSGQLVIEQAISSSCGVYEQRNQGIAKVLDGHVGVLSELQNTTEPPAAPAAVVVDTDTPEVSEVSAPVVPQVPEPLPAAEPEPVAPEPLLAPEPQQCVPAPEPPAAPEPEPTTTGFQPRKAGAW